MGERTNLDMDVLRTFTTGFDLGSFARAADRLGRSQSAISTQLRKLEGQVGQALVRKQGRGLVLTEAGEVMLGYARRILDLNDEAMMAVRSGGAEGVVRFGLPSDFAETWLPAVLGRFKRAHPAVRVEASVDRTTVLLDRLDGNDLDLVLAFGAATRTDAEPLARLPLAWIGGGPTPPPAGEPIPLVTFEARCIFRRLAIGTLDAAGRRWRVDFTSESLTGVWAAVEAGLGLTVRTTIGMPRRLVVLDEDAGLPPLPSIDLCLHDGGRSLGSAASRLKTILLDALPAALQNPGPDVPTPRLRALR